MAEPAFAEMVWYDGRWIDTRHLVSWQIDNAKTANLTMGVLRVAMMIGATCLGFGIGWFCSPQAQVFRRIIAAGVCIVVGLFALGNPTPWGWSAASLIALLGFCWGLGYWLGRGIQSLFETPTTFGSSRWATQTDMEEAGLFDEDGIIIGEAIQNAVKKLFSYKGDRHLLTVAPTRAWKGVSHIIPNLLRYVGSVLVIDVKAENCKITADARRAMGQRVIAVDPMGISGEDAARINPMDLIKLTDPDAPETAMMLAESLVVQSGKASDPFWSAEAKAILQGLILHVAFDESYEGERHLGTVRDLLLLPDDQMTALFENMAASPHHVVASTGARSLQKDPKLMSNVLASAQAETHMLDSARLRDCMSVSDFSFEDLKTDKVSIFIILPPDKLETFGRFLRLIVQQAIMVNARNLDVKPDKPVLFILDEMPALGRLTMVEQAFGLMAGYGIQLWGICQDLSQLRKVYGQDYETFIGNSGVVSYFGSPDKTSAEYFSAMCGVTTVWNLSSAIATALSSSSGGSGGGSSSSSTTTTDNRAATQRKLAYPDELMRLPKNRQLVLVEGTMPIIAEKIRWFEHPMFKSLGVNLHEKPTSE
ncbi:type IV secretory system conjugative DNA transfer family protein [Loktanella sp. D2R18]|nr:type IV secretory system conjugative DNA transfer family protein [Loktanella sp. D2R18]